MKPDEKVLATAGPHPISSFGGTFADVCAHEESEHAMSDLVRYEYAAGVARIVLARPDRANAIDLSTAHALGKAVKRAAHPDVRAVVVRGESARFCAGGDLAAMAAVPDRAAYVQELATTLDGVFQELAALPKPVVAAVEGSVAGAGLALMLSCDVIVAAASTRFVLAYTGVGLTPNCGVSYLLPRAIGQQRALDLALTGRRLTAAEALSWVLVTEVVDDASVGVRADGLAQQLAAGASYALGQGELLLRSRELTREQVGRAEARVIAQAISRPETAALIESFTGRGAARA
ncbi:enoyl-CoA hydratase/isomerase family protein [Streptomyces mirabilis]|jgi:2-(1,2-epoxy-1,2-dihydrophenyl)acetyl-CoA isomerase|uniref:Enoyl-CoA hydratase n=1 Tax=Streptomyces mirabilis TaxID=68239 RepID=A0A1I2XH14_9ACTN|nr:enoyl-CoA hydratase/isomerase family protein [Streptomyces mirabilis]SFH12770.1 Enoyl-CoA hydratase [Streptomyces mirabilis]